MFDCLQRLQLLAAHECERVTDILRASGATDPVHIILRMLGHIVIDHVTHTGDVEPPRCNIGRHHHFVFAALESFECFDSFPLRPVRMQHRNCMMRVLQGMGDAIGVHFCPAKNQDAVEICSLQKRHEQIEFLFGGYRINCVGDSFRRRPARADFN